MEITYIIPTCGFGNLKETIGSILNQSIKPFEIILIQNGVRCEKFENIRSIYLVKNFGYAKAMNLGIINSRTKYLAFINDDVLLPPNWAERIIEEFERDEKLGACSSFIKREDGSIQVGSIEFNKFFEAVEVPYFNEGNLLNFTAIILLKEAIDKTGLLDEDFFSYYEDVDFSLRLIKNGFKLKAIESVFAIHKESSSSKVLRKEFYLFKNKHFTIIKNFGKKFYLKNLLKILRGDIKILKKNPHFLFFYPFIFLRLI